MEDMSINNEWPVEDIPGGDHLYMRAHKQFLREGRLKPGAFRDHGGGMSTDWSEYSTPDETRQRARIPEDNGVLDLPVGEVREITLRVDHAPLPDNRSHTDVVGEKNSEVRLKLGRIATIVLDTDV